VVRFVVSNRSEVFILKRNFGGVLTHLLAAAALVPDFL
jgi:hypothetical protein